MYKSYVCIRTCTAFFAQRFIFSAVRGGFAHTGPSDDDEFSSLECFRVSCGEFLGGNIYIYIKVRSKDYRRVVYGIL